MAAADKTTDELNPISPPAPLPAGAIEPAKRLHPVAESSFHLRETKQNEWLAYASRGTTIDDVLDGSYWREVLPKLRVPDKIIVIADDRSFYLELIVLAVANNFAVVRPFGTPLKLTGAGAIPRIDDQYEIVEIGIQSGWGVRERATGRVLKGDGTLKTRQAAETWFSDWKKINGGKLAA
jgi:hypothetical protein